MKTFCMYVVRCQRPNRAFLSLCIHRAPKAQATTIVGAYGAGNVCTRSRPGLVIRFLSFHIGSPDRAVSGIGRIVTSSLLSPYSIMRYRWVWTLGKGLRREYGS